MTRATVIPGETGSPSAARQIASQPDRFRAFVETFDPPLGSLDGPLSETPIAVKDMFDIAGRTAGWGIGRSNSPASADSEFIARLKKSGARICGVTAMTPLAYEPSAAVPPNVHAINPRNPARITGGSSSGSAAAVAAGLVDIAAGSDTGGSVRIPAHCCGVTALKTSYGAISLDGAMPLAPSLDTIGFMAKSAQVIKPFFEAVALRSDNFAPVTKLVFAPDIRGACAPSISSRLDAMMTSCASVGLTLSDADVKGFIEACDDPFFLILQGEAARSHDSNGLEEFDPLLLKRLQKGFAYSANEIDAAKSKLAALREHFIATVFANADALLLPVMPIETPELTVCDPASTLFLPRTLYALSAFTRFVNAMGLPAVAFPAGVDSAGMPVALQLVGQPGQDIALLDVVAKLQGQSGWSCP